MLLIAAIGGAVLVLAAGVAFMLMHAHGKHGSAAAAPTAATAATAAAAATARVNSIACRGVERELYRQTTSEDPSITLAQVQAEVRDSGIDCTPVAAIVAQMKTLSPDCREIVQYTYLNVRDGHPEISVSDIRKVVVPKAVACEPDRHK